jgi:hypothetical protein
MPAVRQRELPSARTTEALAAADREHVRLELGREGEVERAQARDTAGVGHVLDGRLHQPLERHDAHERQHRQEDEREGSERRAEPRHLADEAEGYEAAGHRREVDAGPAGGL